MVLLLKAPPLLAGQSCARASRIISADSMLGFSLIFRTISETVRPAPLGSNARNPVSSAPRAWSPMSSRTISCRVSEGSGRPAQTTVDRTTSDQPSNEPQGGIP